MHVSVPVPDVVPKRAQRRFGRLGVRVLLDVVTAIDRGASDEVLVEYALKLRLLYVTILRQTKRGEREDADAEPGHLREPGEWKVIRARLQLAEANQWERLVVDLSADVRRACADREEALLSNEWYASQECGYEAWELERRERVPAKVRGGCVRTAAQLLQGARGMIPCRETARMQEELFVTSLDAEAEERLWSAWEKAWAAGERTRAVIRSDTVAQWVRTARAGSQPGG
eukprot:12425849-Karenia_brevis.AAC.1